MLVEIASKEGDNLNVGEIWKAVAPEIPSTITLLGVVIGIWKYRQDRTRSFYERRLTEVYGPLYSRLAKQESFRKLLLPGKSETEYPILKIIQTEKKSTHKITAAGLTEVTSESVSQEVLGQSDFLKVLTEANKGLARPKLLVLISEFEMLTWLSENTASEQKVITDDRMLEVERELVNEIRDGYVSSIKRLKLDRRWNIDKHIL